MRDCCFIGIWQLLATIHEGISTYEDLQSKVNVLYTRDSALGILGTEKQSKPSAIGDDAWIGKF